MIWSPSTDFVTNYWLTHQLTISLLFINEYTFDYLLPDWKTYYFITNLVTDYQIPYHILILLQNTCFFTSYQLTNLILINQLLIQLPTTILHTDSVYQRQIRLSNTELNTDFTITN